MCRQTYIHIYILLLHTCMQIYVCIYVCRQTYKGIHVHKYTYYSHAYVTMDEQLYVSIDLQYVYMLQECTHLGMYIQIYMSLYVYAYICECNYPYMYGGRHVCMYAHPYTCQIYTYIHVYVCIYVNVFRQTYMVHGYICEYKYINTY